MTSRPGRRLSVGMTQFVRGWRLLKVAVVAVLLLIMVGLQLLLPAGHQSPAVQPPPEKQQLPAPQQLTEEQRGWMERRKAFSDAETASMSTLARVLLLGEPRPPERATNFTVAVWRHGPRLERRLLRSYGPPPARPPLQDCAVQNCRIVYTEDSAEAVAADAVLFHLQLTSEKAMPDRRRPDQRWIFLSDESPHHAFLTRNNISHYNGVFNWSMGYRHDTDVPVPYGRTEPGRADAELPQPPGAARTKLAAILGSNCDGSGRWQLVKDLQKLVQVDVYGHCGTLKCAGHYNQDCPALNDYKFYLSLENSHCDGYITEKVFWNALGKGAVPIVWGAKRRDYEKMLPPKSFIFVEDFPTVEALAKYMTFLDKNPSEYERYHAWRDSYHVLNEHGYFGSPIHYYCRICEALNYNTPAATIISKIDSFWGVQDHCMASDKQKDLLQRFA